MPTPRRQNGLSRPYSNAQISAWVALIATVFEFLVFVTPILPLAASIPVTIFFLILALAVVYYGGKTQLVDPMDVHLARHLSEQSSSSDSEPLPEEEMKHCWICDVQVAQHSMHCKYCNKCVYHFDHHCMWLNTCVGSANYPFFFRTMLFLFAMEVSHFVIQLVLLINSFTGGPTADRVGDWLGTGPSSSLEPLVHAVLIFFIIFSFVSIIMIGQLLWFHVGLQREKITTYEYIVRDHKRKREQVKLADELKIQRTLAVNKATQEGKKWQARRLQTGGYCREMGCVVCDPMELPEPPKEPDPEDGFAAALGGGPPAPLPPPPAAAEAPLHGTTIGGGEYKESSENNSSTNGANMPLSGPQFINVNDTDEGLSAAAADEKRPSAPTNGATNGLHRAEKKSSTNGSSRRQQQRQPPTMQSQGPERFI